MHWITPYLFYNCEIRLHFIWGLFWSLILELLSWFRFSKYRKFVNLRRELRQTYLSKRSYWVTLTLLTSAHDPTILFLESLHIRYDNDSWSTLSSSSVFYMDRYWSSLLLFPCLKILCTSKRPIYVLLFLGWE